MSTPETFYKNIYKLPPAHSLTGARRDLVVRVEQLAEAQRRTEERVAELAEAQARTEQALERLSQQVGGLSETVGGDAAV